MLPRQLCNLYTKTYKFEHFAEGKEGIQHMAQGGYVFEVLVNNLVRMLMLPLKYVQSIIYQLFVWQLL